MTQGDLDTSIYPDFFITSTPDPSTNHLSYDLIKDSDNNTNAVTAPRFMLHIVNRVLAAGKTVTFLKRMDPIPCTLAQGTNFTPFLRERIHRGGGVDPFEQAFESALDEWVGEKYEVVSRMLRTSIHEGSELWRIVGGVQGVYCLLHYSAMTRFTQLLFQRVLLPHQCSCCFCSSGTSTLGQSEVHGRWISRSSGGIDTSLQTTYKNPFPPRKFHPSQSYPFESNDHVH